MTFGTSAKSALFASATIIAGFAALSASLTPPRLDFDKLCAAPRKAPGGGNFGTVHFANSCSAAVQPTLQREIAKLHSFETIPQDFSAIAARDPKCAIAWWGAAMAERGNALGGALDDKTLQRGRALADGALARKNVTPREKGLIDAMDVYYKPYPDQIRRARAYAEKMDALHAAYPDDPDIGALDGLAIIEGVDLNDKTYARQKRAGILLEAVMKAYPDHPGAPHYLIHAYDYTALAPQAVRAAETYPSLAPASSHAQHMPSHIWSMLGRWDRSIEANRASSYVADEKSGRDAVKGDIVYEHAFDFIAYARLQKAQDKHVADDIAALRSAPLIVTARYPLERGDWRAAAGLRVPTDDAFDAALARFTRAYGAARSGDAKAARVDLVALKALRASVVEGAGEYWGIFVDIYAQTAEAWALKAEGRNEEALALMRRAATRDDGHEKHIYLENKVLPARETLADMELALGQPKAALADYEASLRLAPNRYRSFLGAGQAAEAVGDKDAARDWYGKLLTLAKDGDPARPGFAQAQAYLAGKG